MMRLLFVTDSVETMLPLCLCNRGTIAYTASLTTEGFPIQGVHNFEATRRWFHTTLLNRLGIRMVFGTSRNTRSYEPS